MAVRKPAPGDLEPIETASRDELQALQLKRLQWSLAHAYDHVAHYRKAFDRAGSIRAIAGRSPISRGFRSPSRPTCATTIRSRCSRCRGASRSHPRLVGHDRQADGRRLHARRHRHLGATSWRGRFGPPVAGGRHHPRILRLRAVHWRPRGPLRRRAAWCDGDSDVRRPDRKAGAADPGFQAQRHHGDAVVHAGDRRGNRTPGHRSEARLHSKSAFSAPSRGPRRCARRSRRRLDIDAIDIYGLSEVIGPGVAQECIETKDGLDDLGGSFLPGDHRSRDRRALPDGEKGELVFTSLTKEALPIIRYRTRDLTRLLPATARTMRRMEKITGRSDDMMIIRGVNVFPTQIEELMSQAVGRLAPHYQLELVAKAARRTRRASSRRAATCARR